MTFRSRALPDTSDRFYMTKRFVTAEEHCNIRTTSDAVEARSKVENAMERAEMIMSQIGKAV